MVVQQRQTSSCRSRTVNLLFEKILSGDRDRSAGLAVPAESVPSVHIRWRTTAIRRATATMARRMPQRCATFIPQALSHDQCRLWVSSTCAASYGIVRSMVSPDLETPPS